LFRKCYMQRILVSSTFFDEMIDIIPMCSGGIYSYNIKLGIKRVMNVFKILFFQYSVVGLKTHIMSYLSNS
jgi:hypothetical protein